MIRCFRLTFVKINLARYSSTISELSTKELSSGDAVVKMDSRPPPVVVVLGSTGTGKSDLAIDIARRFDGEIISADSMQVYRGLDIVTNKVTPDQIAAVPHHLIDYVDPLANYTVVDFRNQALPIIQRIQDSGKIPIIVGGTNYYIESLLWKVLVANGNRDSADESSSEDDSSPQWAPLSPYVYTESGDVPIYHSHKQADITAIPNEALHRHLGEVDPDMAALLHPNNRRKILRSLQVYEQLGRPHSQILAEQKSLKGGSSLGGPLRFPVVHIFWIRFDQTELDKNLDARVDAMLEAGLLEELSNFHRDYNEHRLSKDCNSVADYTRGIFQSIGFKEFHSYLILSEDERASDQGQKLLKEGIILMKIATKRYARKQQKWIYNRFLKCPDRDVPPVYALDVAARDPISRIEKVTNPALTIMEDLLKMKIPNQSPLQVEKSNDLDKLTLMKCTLCNVFMQGPTQFQVHMNSRRHKIMKDKIKKRIPADTFAAEEESQQISVNTSEERAISPSGK